MGLLKKIYDRIGEVTDRNNPDFWEEWHSQVGKFAYLAWGGDSSKSAEHYWNASKAYLAVRTAINDGKFGKLDWEDNEVIWSCMKHADRMEKNHFGLVGIWSSKNLCSGLGRKPGA